MEIHTTLMDWKTQPDKDVDYPQTDIKLNAILIKIQQEILQI